MDVSGRAVGDGTDGAAGAHGGGHVPAREPHLVRYLGRELLFEADEDDSLGLRKMIAWAEDAWMVIGFFWLILYPIVVLIILGVLLGSAFLLKKYFQYKEERSKINKRITTHNISEKKENFHIINSKPAESRWS